MRRSVDWSNGMYVCRSLRLGWVKLYAIGWTVYVARSVDKCNDTQCTCVQMCMPI